MPDKKIVACKECGKDFESIKDHGVWKTYCNRVCFCANGRPDEKRKCLGCGDDFISVSSARKAGRRIYCSHQCYGKSLENGIQRNCLQCGEEYHVSNANLKSYFCCSTECALIYYTGEKSKAWKGGEYIDATKKEAVVYHPRKGRVSKYAGKHRIIASDAVGRDLEQTEVVMFLDHNKLNCVEDNLYICRDFKEFRAYQFNRTPYPTKSNLSIY